MHMYHLDAIIGKHDKEHLKANFKNTKDHQRSRFLYSQGKINDEILDTFNPSQKVNVFSAKYLKALMSRTKTDKIIKIVDEWISSYLQKQDREQVRSYGDRIYEKINQLEKHIKERYGIEDTDKRFFIIANLYNSIYRHQEKKNSHHKDVFILEPEKIFMEDEICTKAIKDIIAICRESNEKWYNIDHFFAGFGAYFFQKYTEKIDTKLRIVVLLSKLFWGIDTSKIKKNDPMFLAYRYTFGGDMIQDLFFFQYDFLINQIYTDLVTLETIKGYGNQTMEQSFQTFMTLLTETDALDELSTHTYLKEFFSKKYIANIVSSPKTSKLV